MSRFTDKGMWRFPLLPRKKKPSEVPDEIMVVKKCFCPNGHNLVSPRVDFKGYSGIMMKVKKNKRYGYLALSPICGDKSKLTLDIDLTEGEILELLCPVCDVPLPVYAPCDCGGDMITLFADDKGNYCNCIGVCNRVGCSHAEIKNPDELFALYRKKGEIKGRHDYK